MPDSKNELVEHYQKTYELTYELWGQRNKTFLILIGVIGVATLLTYRAPDTNSLLVDIIANTLGVSEHKERVDELRKSFPFALLQSILLLVVFYLMVNLFHRSLYVLRNYAYLGSLEGEIEATCVSEKTALHSHGKAVFIGIGDHVFWDSKVDICVAPWTPTVVISYWAYGSRYWRGEPTSHCC